MVLKRMLAVVTYVLFHQFDFLVGHVEQDLFVLTGVRTRGLPGRCLPGIFARRRRSFKSHLAVTERSVIVVVLMMRIVVMGMMM